MSRPAWTLRELVAARDGLRDVLDRYWHVFAEGEARRMAHTVARMTTSIVEIETSMADLLRGSRP